MTSKATWRPFRCFVVVTGDWFLRGTVWTSDEDRASKFDTEEKARAALLKAKPFMKPGSFQGARVVPN